MLQIILVILVASIAAYFIISSKKKKAQQADNAFALEVIDTPVLEIKEKKKVLAVKKTEAKEPKKAANKKVDADKPKTKRKASK
jgi:hypothetical protein